MSTEILLLVIWIATVSVISLAVTVYDKWAARNSTKNRIPEKTLFLLALAGGSAVMYLTMRLIRHKTRHKRFMIGLPMIILVQIGLILYFVRFR